MREIKFRAWSKEHKRMITDPSDKEYVLVVAIGELLENGKGVFYPTAKKVVLMQYTGFKDKQGKEIYEGDIVRGGDGYIGSVVFDPADGYGVGNSWWSLLAKDWEVIGNIYENPELLEEKKNKVNKRNCKHWWVERNVRWGRGEWVCEYCGITKEEWEVNKNGNKKEPHP